MAAPTALPPVSKPTIRVIDMRRHPSLEPARTGRTDFTFSYMHGAEGPFTVSVPAEEMEDKSEAEQDRVLADYVNRAQAQRLHWKGREIAL